MNLLAGERCPCLNHAEVTGMEEQPQVGFRYRGFFPTPLERHTRKSQGCALAVEPKAIFHCYKMVRPVHLKGSSKIS